MFQSRAGESSRRYRAGIVTGEMRQKCHQASVQKQLHEGAGRGWQLVSANTTNATGDHVTGIYWDTAPER